jgi:hypothetical protein
MAAASCLLGFWYLYALILPFHRLPEGIWHLARHPGWRPINLLGVAGTVLASLGLVLVWQVHPTPTTTTGMLLAVAGLQLLGGTLAWDAILWPILAREHTELLAFDGPLYQSRALLGFFGVAGLLFSAGYVVLAVGVDASAIPRVAMGVGAPLFAFGPLFGSLQVWVRSVGITLLSLGQAGLVLL